MTDRRRDGLTVLLYAITVLALAAGALTLHAQAPTGYVLKLSTQAGAAVSTTPIPLSLVTCGITPKTTISGGVTNPKKVIWDDPASPATLDCVYTDPGTGPLFALPFGATAYLAVVDVTNSAGTSPDSLPSNSFTRPGTVAPALTGVRVVP